MIKSGFAFIASHLQIEGMLPVELVPGHTIRAAMDTEVTDIRNYLEQSKPRDNFLWVPYDGLVKEEHIDSQTTFYIESLPREKWKYWVLAFEGTNRYIHELELVGQLLPVNFDFGFVFFYSEPSQAGVLGGRLVMPLHIIDRYTSHNQAYANAESVTSEQLASLGNLFHIYEALLPEYVFVNKALSSFADLRRVPSTSELVIVGLFSIIESLITHAPRLSETLDSINHQITNKIILLRKRYSRTILPSQYFLHATEDNIWKKLYGYRSAVAHGTSVSFESDYLILKDRETVVRFLKDNLKELLLIALREPAFIFDLRKC